MPITTEYAKLEKPLVTENYNIAVFNSNADKLDAALKSHNAQLASKAQVESGTWTILSIGGCALEQLSATYMKIGPLVTLFGDVKVTFATNLASQYFRIYGAPYVISESGGGSLITLDTAVLNNAMPLGVCAVSTPPSIVLMCGKNNGISLMGIGDFPRATAIRCTFQIQYKTGA